MPYVCLACVCLLQYPDDDDVTREGLAIKDLRVGDGQYWHRCHSSTWMRILQTEEESFEHNAEDDIGSTKTPFKIKSVMSEIQGWKDGLVGRTHVYRNH
jgi:hypothetical protein